MKVEPQGKGRSTVFVLSKKFKEEERIKKLEPRAKRKDKRIVSLSQIAQRTLEERDAAVKKKVKLEQEKKVVEQTMEEEKGSQSNQEFSLKVESL